MFKYKCRNRNKFEEQENKTVDGLKIHIRMVYFTLKIIQGFRTEKEQRIPYNVRIIINCVNYLIKNLLPAPALDPRSVLLEKT